LLLEYLTDQCGVLETQNPEDPQVRALAREAWGRGAVEAERLGNTRLRNRLEDAALRVLDAAAFERVSRGVAALTESHTDWLDSRESEIRAALREAGVPWVELQRRTKHVAGIWRKMQSKDLALEQVQDIFGFRVLVGDETDCYRTLEALHRRYRPHLLRFKDYIATPKANGYQSLHTSVRAEDGVELEIQVRTVEMHARAGNGVAAHWVYKSQSGVSAASISPWQRLRQRLLPGR
jgi:(p)ppGpp synthase/HD superfamily hydrolase